MKILSAFLYASSTVCLYADKKYLLSVKTNILLIMSFVLNLLNIFLFQNQILFYIILGINIMVNAFLFRMDDILKMLIYSLLAIIELLFLHYAILVFCYYKNIVNFPYFVESILFIFFVYGMRTKIQNISVIDGYIFSGLFISLNMIAIFAAIKILEGSEELFNLLPSIIIYLILLIFACALLLLNKQQEIYQQKEMIINDTKKYITNFQTIEKKYIDYKHDVLHEIANISHCLEMNDTSKIKESINRIANLDKENNLNFFSNNLYINSLMKSKVEDNPDICFDIDIKISSSLQEEIMDVCVVLSNTIDQYCELIHSNHLEKKLKLKCIQKNDMFIMLFSSIYKDGNNNFQISENANRITMIKKIVNEKNGSMQMKNSKNSYTIEIIMNL